jgi:hypothetical protein
LNTIVMGDDGLALVASLAGVTLSTTGSPASAEGSVALPKHATVAMAATSATPRRDAFHMSAILWR